MFKEGFKIKPNDTDSLYMIGLCFSKLERYNDAIQFFDKVLEINQNDIFASYFALYFKGISLAFLGNHKEAVECLDKALSINQKSLTNMESKSFIT